MKVTVCRKEHFNAAHRLYNPDWDNAKNDLVFGKCNNPSFHGHNYNLEVKVRGEIDPNTGYVIDTKHLKKLIRENILEILDHKNLNLDVPAFANQNPTAENIAVFIWNILRNLLNEKYDLRIVLYETERNFVEYAGE